MLFVETAVFTRQILGAMSDEMYRLLQVRLTERPDMGAVIPGSGGLRKIRWGVPGRGKRDGVRVIYYWVVAQDIVLMLFVYPKNVQADLTPRQIQMLRAVVEEEYP